jgi:hypothetical protein
MTTDINIEEAVTAAKSSYGLLDRLRRRPILTDTVTIYLDEPTGRALGGVEQKVRHVAGVQIPDGVRRWGVRGKIDEVKAQDASAERDALLEALRAEEAVLRAKLDESAITVHLQALPRFIRDEATAAAKSALSLEDGVEQVPEDREAEYQTNLSAELTVRMVTSMFDADGASLPPLSVADVKELDTLLPDSESLRLAKAIAELQYQTAIAENVTENADF